MTHQAYEYNDNGIFKHIGKEQLQLTNFLAEITEQVRYHDDKNTDTVLKIIGAMGKEDLPEIHVSAHNFQSMAWVTNQWGVVPVILPVPNAERDVRTAIQYFSKPASTDVYKTTGWTKINKHDAYLHGNGAISAKGNDPTVRVELPPDLRRYSFELDPSQAKAAYRASLTMPALGNPDITWPLLLAAYRSVIMPADFAIHLAGRTGTFKTEVCALIQSHFGPMDARQIPGSWSSTANALEALAYYARNAVMVIDDYVPTGTAWQVKTLNKTADQLIRGQGNQAGRARLSDRTNLQTTYYPRGIIMSTGEDIPEGHSVRARMMIIETSPGDIEPAKLSDAQERRPMYQNAMGHWIQWLADSLAEKRAVHKQIAQNIRDQSKDLGHNRTPSMLGELLATADMVLTYGTAKGYINKSEAQRIHDSATASLTAAAAAQKDHMEESDPADAFLDVLKQVTLGHLGHFTTRDGTSPEYAALLGWTESVSPGGTQTYKPHGPQLGWIEWDENEAYIDVNALKYLARHASGKISMTRQTLLKRLKDAGALTRTDDARKRNTIRITAENHTRNVIAIRLSQLTGADDE